MKFYKNMYMISFFMLLQPVLLQSVAEDDYTKLVTAYKTDHTSREKYSSFYHRLFNNKNYKAAQEAQRQLDNAELERLKNNADERQGILNTKEWWHNFWKPKHISLAEQAQKEMDEITKVAGELKQSKEPVNFDMIDRLNTWKTQDLIHLAKQFNDQSCPKFLLHMLTRRFIEAVKDFPHDGVKYLILSDDIISKLVNYKYPSLITTFQIENFFQYNRVTLTQLIALKKLLAPSQVVPEILQISLNRDYENNTALFIRQLNTVHEQNKDFFTKDLTAYVSPEVIQRVQSKAQAETPKKAQSQKQPKRNTKTEELPRAGGGARSRSEDPEVARKARLMSELESKYPGTIAAAQKFGFTGDILNSRAWKDFYRAKALELHSDKHMGDSPERQAFFKEKMQELNALNENLQGFYREKKLL